MLVKGLTKLFFFSVLQDFIKNVWTVIWHFKLEACPCSCKSLDVPWLRNMNLSWSKNWYTRLLWLMMDKPQKFIVRVQIIIHNLMCSLQLVRQRIAHMIRKASLRIFTGCPCLTLITQLLSWGGKDIFGHLLSEDTEYVNCRRNKCWRKTVLGKNFQWLTDVWKSYARNEREE